MRNCQSVTHGSTNVREGRGVGAGGGGRGGCPRRVPTSSTSRCRPSGSSPDAARTPGAAPRGRDEGEPLRRPLPRAGTAPRTRSFDGRQKATLPSTSARGPTARWCAPRPGAPPVAGNYHGRGFADPSHGWTGGRFERNGGNVRRVARTPSTGNDEFTLATYDAADVPVWAQLDPRLPGLRPLVLLAARADAAEPLLPALGAVGRPEEQRPAAAARPGAPGVAPRAATGRPIWTLLRGVRRLGDLLLLEPPADRVLGRAPPRARPARSPSTTRPRAAGTLPQLSIIDPWFIAPEGLANDDHPHADIRLGQAFISDVVEAFGSSPLLPEGRAGGHLRRVGRLLGPRRPAARCPTTGARRPTPAARRTSASSASASRPTIISPVDRTHRTKARRPHRPTSTPRSLKFVSRELGPPVPHASGPGARTASRGRSAASGTFDADADFVPYDVAAAPAPAAHPRAERSRTSKAARCRR